MFTLNATIEDHTISATSQDGDTFYVTLSDTGTGQNSQHSMTLVELMRIYNVAMLGDNASADDWCNAEAWYTVNPDAVRIIP